MTATRAGITLGLILVVGACGDSGGGASTFADFCATTQPQVDAFITRMGRERPITDSVRYGGTVVLGNIGDMTDGMNHFVSSIYDGSQHQQFVNLMTPVQYDADLVPQPYLAESWEVDDPDNPTAITFHLRPDVLWHDGTRTDAEDFAFIYRVVTDSAAAYPNAAFWDHYVRGPEGVEVIDSVTVRILLRPHAEYMDPWTRMSVMPRHLLEGVPVTELKQHPYGTVCPVGNGPFVFVEHRPQESWTFRANPAFPVALGGRPFLDRYVFRVIADQSTLLTDLLTENIDVFVGLRPDQAPEVLRSARHQLLTFPSRQYNYVGWNARRPQLVDRRVRRALTLGFNRHQIVQTQIQGYGQVANSGIPPFHWAFDPSLADSLRYDPAQARRLLDEAGWTDRDGDGVRENADGVPLQLAVTYNQGNQQRQDIAEIMQAQLSQIGVRVQPRVMEFGTMVDMLHDPARNFDAVIIGWVTEFKLDDIDLFHSVRIDKPYAYSGTNNPEIDRYLDTLQLIPDRSAAIPVWGEYDKLIVQEQPYTYLYFPDRLVGVARRVRDIQMDERGEWLNIKDWWIPRDERGQARPSSR